jgi:hypothetical protein
MTSGSPRRAARRLLVVTAAGVLAVAAVGAVLLLGRDDSGTAGDPSRCRVLAADGARACYRREFSAMVAGLDDPRPAVAEIAESAWREGGFLLTNCHGVMHTVGRTYARDTGVTLATLMEYLPRSNDPGCSAGFAHGLVTGVAPDVDPRRPMEATSACGEAGTRYQRYSCVHGFGHAFMRIHRGRLTSALELCGALGRRAAPDCAQGVYHDYWFAVIGADDARLAEDAVTDPRQLCAAQPAAFVRPCWYRAFVDNRPGVEIAAAEDLDALCAGLGGLQREACMTAASVIGPPDPAVQLQLCAGLSDATDSANCVRGTKVQNLLGRPTATYVGLIRGCELFAGTTRASCYRWLGKTLAVVTDGEFARAGCPQLASADARRHCRAGAASLDEALVTFS